MSFIDFLKSNQTFIFPFIDDKPLLPGQSRVTHFTNKRQVDYKIHYGFTSNEEILIKNALQIIGDRLFQSEILENMYRICGTSGALLGEDVWSRSQLENDRNYRGRYDLLRFQVMCLKNMKFPTINLYPMYEKSDTQSVGTVGCVSCISHGSIFSVKGQFEVKLNRYNLNACDQSNVTNSIYWAGVIVHEMLHNLGHRHMNDDYTDRWQINIFQKCFISNGKYSPP
jgi:hypothetical protein